ncbi:MAG: hypothetical protein HY908_23485 [Myxococcales bacterium]|nr:hypothetical protein [Myxococcales bacterium]
MVGPIAIDEPPTFWLRLFPGVALEVALGGELAPSTMFRLLSDARLLGLVREHRPTRAILDLSYAATLPAESLELATGWWSSSLAALGCRRIALVLKPEILWQKWAPPPAEVELFDPRSQAEPWLARPADGPAASGAFAPASAPTPPPASPPPGPVLAARCLAEAHLYLDLRGAPRERTEELVATPDGPVTVLTARGAGADPPARFAFRVAEPAGRLGTGGVRGPSAILGPAELLVWADILSKRAPGSGDGLSAREREAARDDVLTAAACLEEILKFVPPGQQAVPASAFGGEAARRVYEKEPGRFNGARLEVVAETYRRIGSSY